MIKIKKTEYEEIVSVDDIALYFNGNKTISENFYNFLNNKYKVTVLIVFNLI